jgi:hypothetical protein
MISCRGTLSVFSGASKSLDAVWFVVASGSVDAGIDWGGGTDDSILLDEEFPLRADGYPVL